MPLRLLIVDDNAYFLQAARALLESEGMSVVGVASTSVEALRGVQDLQPDVTLVDIDLGEESGFELARLLTEATGGQRLRVILISAYDEQELADLIEDSSAVGFLPKSRLSRRAIAELLETDDDGRPELD